MDQKCASKMIVIALLLSLQMRTIFPQEHFCNRETFRCESYLRQSDCPFNEFIEIDKSLSCCPTCRGGMGM